MKIIKIAVLFAAAVLAGCATTPPFDCADARDKIIKEIEIAREAANEYHAAQGRKNPAYYGIKAARAATCIGSLGLLCDVADKIASDNTRVDENAKAAQLRYKKSAETAEGLRNAMEKNGCVDIPQIDE